MLAHSHKLLDANYNLYGTLLCFLLDTYSNILFIITLFGREGWKKDVGMRLYVCFTMSRWGSELISWAGIGFKPN